jgi:[NiFe] hydrogenase diaphorase moiety large subunit
MTNPNEMTYATIEKNAGLQEALEIGRVDVIKMIRESGMKGRGGAGFPTGVKWNLAAAAQGDSKYVICNADEGEPGTFKDRAILSEFPELVFEGMTIAAYAINAKKGFLYLRGEYTYLKKSLEDCLQKRREEGLLGKSILGTTGFDFDIQIFMGCGAYICGEETALIESLEGYRGEARNRPPFPVNTGLSGMPTVVNNVETFAWACTILNKGVDWFRASGTEQSTGPKILSVSGDVTRPGVYEFPMGTPISTVLEAAGGRDAKAAIIGGASGHCIPAADFSRTICYEDVATGGSIIVIGPQRDLLQIVENFIEFFVEESCGQCTPCRIGSQKLLEGVEMLKSGTCSSDYLKELCSLGETLQMASKCGLGQSAPNVFLSTVNHFRGEILGRISNM